MPRVVPSDVVAAADRMFEDASKAPRTFPNAASETVPTTAAFVRLVDAVPAELLTLTPERYAALVASVEYLRSLGDVFRARQSPYAIALRLRGYDENPVAIIRGVMATCPDEAPALGTEELLFVKPKDLRDSIRLDISNANRDLAEGRWKGATVLAGAAVEALLLWRLEKEKAGTVSAAVAVLVAAGTFKQDAGRDLKSREWSLHGYIELAGHLNLITPETATLVRLTKDFRNLIHPARERRVGQKCDRTTAFTALAAVAGVVRDLKP